jgi:hypothetical protein
MKQVVVAIKDRAADAFGRPAFVASIGVAIRSFSDEVNRSDAENQMFHHPDDFDLYELASYDDSTGIVEMLENPKLLILGKNAKVQSS